ncbi:MAG: TatD family hydrolase, partial [Pseudomonadota bacterium]
MASVKQLPEIFNSQEVRSVGWTDVHAHLNFLEITPKQAVEEALSRGMNRIITIGTEPGDLKTVLKLADEFSPNVFCTLGIHPHEAKVYDDEVKTFLETNLSNPRVVAVGEIGLDYYYNQSPVDKQLHAFRAQMEIAEKFQLPVEIHTRDAEDDTIEILQDFKGRVKGIIHCFTGSQNLADVALDCGYNISFSGIVTFKNAKDLQDVCRTVPLDRMHVETDAP